MAVQIPFPIPNHGYALNSKMRINLDYIVQQFNQFNTGTATWDTVAIGIANSETGILQFLNSSNAFYLNIQAGATAANITYTLPATNPANPAYQFLMCNAAGTMHWSTLNFPDTVVGNQLLYVDGASTIKEVAVGSGNKILVNSTPPSFFSLLGTSHQIIVTGNVSDFTLSTPQNIDTTSNVTFNQLIVDGGSATNPGLGVIFSGSSHNTGIFSTSGTSLSVTVAGVLRGTWDNTGDYTSVTSIHSPTYRATTSYLLSTGSSGIITIQADGVSGGTYTLTLPVDDGNANQVLTTDGSGVLSWTTPSGTGANTALSNLASVAINTSLLPTSDNSIDVGSTTKNWRSIYLSTSIKNGSTTLATATELGYLTGVTSAIQTQLGAKAPLASPTFTGTVTTPNIAITDTSNQLVIGTTRTVTLTAPTPATSSRTVTIPDLIGDYTLVGTIGSQTIGGSKTFSSAIAISATSNHLVLSTSSNTLTINANAQATSARTWSIPDISGAGTFAALEGTQTFTGTKTFNDLRGTFGANIAAGSNKITGLAAGTSAGDSLRFEQLKVIQVVTATSESNFTTTSNTYQTTNCSASITPTSSSNSILILATGWARNAAAASTNLEVAVFRDSTILTSGTTVLQQRLASGTALTNIDVPCAINAKDAPSSTSAITYSVKIRSSNNSTTVGFNATGGQTTIILMEVAP